MKQRSITNRISSNESDMVVAVDREQTQGASTRNDELLFGPDQSTDTTVEEQLLLLSPAGGQTPIKESVLFFLSAVGCTIGWTAVLSNLVYYTDTLGVDSFLFLNLAVYAPLLPVTLAQAIWDAQFDRRFRSLRSFWFRGTVSFSVALICLMLLPWTSKSLVLLSVTSVFLGLSSAVLQGMMIQMASFVYPSCGRLSAAVTAGMQASAVLVLAVSVTSGFGGCASSEELRSFYFTIAFLLVVCWVCFQILLNYSQGVVRSMKRRDSLFLSSPEMVEPLLSSEEPLLSSTHEQDEDNQVQADAPPQDIVELSFSDIWIKTWPVCFVIMLTVGSSMSVASWFNRVESQDATNAAFPQVLFYTRLLADLMGRLSTLYGAPKSIVSLVALAVLRLGFVPIFFIYTLTNLIPKNDVAAALGVFGFAFTSGYLATLSYQFAPTLLSDHERERNTTKQASLINVCFSASVLLGLAASFVLNIAIDS